VVKCFEFHVGGLNVDSLPLLPACLDVLVESIILVIVGKFTLGTIRKCKEVPNIFPIWCSLVKEMTNGETLSHFEKLLEDNHDHFSCKIPILMNTKLLIPQCKQISNK
jgi:hypothetical protein